MSCRAYYKVAIKVRTMNGVPDPGHFCDRWSLSNAAWAIGLEWRIEGW